MACGSAIKTDWYQTEVAVVVTLMVKNLKEDQLKVRFTETHLNLAVKLPDNSDGEEKSIEYKLAHKIVPDCCSYKIMSTKVEIKLKKKEGIRWENLEGDPEVEGPKAIPQASRPVLDKPPSYPTSKGTNWSAIEKEITEQEKNEKPEGEEALNKLFQEIYGKGSDEVKKAMNKSYMESGGTVLSTNWNEIGTKKVDVKPPDGMEFKKWD